MPFQRFPGHGLIDSKASVRKRRARCKCGAQSEGPLTKNGRRLWWTRTHRVELRMQEED